MVRAAADTVVDTVAGIAESVVAVDTVAVAAVVAVVVASLEVDRTDYRIERPSLLERYIGGTDTTAASCSVSRLLRPRVCYFLKYTPTQIKIEYPPSIRPAVGVNVPPPRPAEPTAVYQSLTKVS